MPPTAPTAPPADPLQAAAARARAWLLDAAFPLWAAAGRAPAGDFIESLDLSGRPERDAPRRTLVQARQIYAFCEAARLGWSGDGAAVARGGLDRLLTRNWSPDGAPGWVHSLGPAGAPADPRRQLYDHAFVLFAHAHAHDALSDPRARPAADATLAFLDAALADPAHGGFQEGLPAALPRRSNPHMHLLEAMLAWFEATGEDAFRRRAQALVDLFARAFFDPATGVLGEHFTADWRPAPAPEGDTVEPGHLYEWVWLLAWAERRGVTAPTGAAHALFAFAEAHGRDPSGFVVDECDRSGRQVRRSRRLWPQTERLKALVARARGGDRDAAAAAAAATHAVIDGYLAGPVAGGWIDRFDADGRPAVDRIPASSLYHLTLAFRQLSDRAAELAPAAPPV